LTAADGLEYAYEKGSPAGEVKSLFSSRLIEGIEGGYADLDGDGLISVDELYRYVEERIRQEDPSQKPQKLGQVYGQLWIGRAVPRPDAIPRNVLDLLNHNYPTARLAGIDELERLLTVAKDVLYPAASQALTKLLSDGDGTVQRVAASALRRLEAERRESEEKKRLEAERRETEAKERLEAERRQKEQQERLEAERWETEAKERLEAERRQKEQQERLEAERRETEAKERLEAERRQKEQQERLEAEQQAQPPTPVAPSTPPAKPEADKPGAETPKVVYPLPPKSTEPEHEKPPPSSPNGTGRKSPSKQVIAFLATATVLVVGGLIYVTSRPFQSRPPQLASVAAVTPSPPVIATPLTPQPTTPTSTPTAAESFAQAQRYLDTKDFANALPLFQKAADGGNTSAMNKLGDLYYDGKGVAQDSGKAREWYQKAADAGNAIAMTNLGWLYGNGKGVAQDSGKAREWYQKGADAGNTDAMYNLGVLYANGKGVAQDYDKAREWYQKAADAGNTDAKQALASQSPPPQPAPVAAVIPQPTTPTSTPSAADWFAQAQRYLNTKDFANALPLLQKAADAGDAEAMYNLGRLYQYGNGVAQDYALTYQWYQKAAAAGNADAMNNLGSLYEYGRGVAKDYRKAREWYQKAADTGDAEAMHNLGRSYEYGKGVAQDYGKAREWYQKAAAAGFFNGR
jgi:TPR repeat protein